MPTTHLINGKPVTVITFAAKEDKTDGKGKVQQFYVVSNPNSFASNRAFSRLLFAKSNDILELGLGVSPNNLGGPSLPGYGAKVFAVENISSPVYNF